MNRAVFLDRDGTINKDKDYIYRVEDCEYVDGAIDGLRVLSEAGFKLIIITNQSGIARGYYTEDDYKHFMDWMVSDLKSKGVYITDHYYCPHLPGAKIKKYDMECGCRKPGTDLFYKAVKEHDIDIDNSFAVGDRLRDLYICENTGVQGILLCGNKGTERALFQYSEFQTWDEIVRYINY